MSNKCGVNEIFNAVMCECLARRMSISKAHVTPTGGGCISFRIYLQKITFKLASLFHILEKELNDTRIVRFSVFKLKCQLYLIKNNDKVVRVRT